MLLSHPARPNTLPLSPANEMMKRLLAIRSQLFKEMFYKTNDTSERGFEIICKVIQMQ